MAARKYFRENLGFTFEQMCAVTGASKSAIYAMEQRRRDLPPEFDEIYQLYFRFGDHSAPLKFDDLHELHLEITQFAREKLKGRIAELETKGLLYKMQFEQLECKYIKALQSKRGFEYIKVIASNGSDKLHQRVALYAAIHSRKVTEKYFLKLTQLKIQIEWIKGEIKAIHDMLEYVIKEQ
jgi:transcriptional regulator with XRE-family HTH domain